MSSARGWGVGSTKQANRRSTFLFPAERLPIFYLLKFRLPTGHRPPTTQAPNTQSPKPQPLRATAAFPGLAAAVLGDAGREITYAGAWGC